jgi:DNA repair exonuclease SbcCD ATPase subunit
MSSYSNPLLNFSVEVDCDHESAMKECDPSHANLEKKYTELKEEYAKYKEDSYLESPTRECYSAYAKLQRDYDELKEEYDYYKEQSKKTISRHEGRIEQLRDDLIDHIFSRGIGSGEEKEGLKGRTTDLEEGVQDGDALREENLMLKAEKVQLQSELQRYQEFERERETDRKEKIQQDGEYAALWSAYERLGNELVDATNRLNSQSAREPNYFKEVQELQVRNSELVKENQELKLSVGNATHLSMEVERLKNRASDLNMKLLLCLSEKQVLEQVVNSSARMPMNQPIYGNHQHGQKIEEMQKMREEFVINNMTAQHREAIERAKGQSYQQEAMKLKAQNHQLGTALLACQGENRRLYEIASSLQAKIEQLEEEKQQIVELSSKCLDRFEAQNLSFIEEFTKIKTSQLEQEELVGQALLELSTKLERIVEGIIQGFRNRFGDRVRFTKMMFIMLCKKLEVNAKKRAGSLWKTIDDERLVQEIREITETIREDGVMPLQKLVLDLEQEGEQARQKVKWYKEEVDRIFGGECLDDNDAEGGAQPELAMEGSEEISPRVDEPETFTPDTNSDSTREDWEMVNIYDSETDEETELSLIPGTFAAYVESDDEV